MSARNVLTTALVACSLFAVTGGRQAMAQPLTFTINGTGIAPQGLPLPWQAPRVHWSTGYATGLGLYHGTGTVMTETANFHNGGFITGEFGSGSPYVFVGSNGDILTCEYGLTAFGASTPGTFKLVPAGPPGVFVAYFLAEFVPVTRQCTGKFAGATGKWTMYATTAPFVLGSMTPTAYTWFGSGTLFLQGGH